MADENKNKPNSKSHPVMCALKVVSTYFSVHGRQIMLTDCFKVTDCFLCCAFTFLLFDEIKVSVSTWLFPSSRPPLASFVI